MTWGWGKGCSAEAREGEGRGFRMRDMNFSIRRARAGDVEVIAEYNVAMAWETEQLRLDPATVLRGVGAALADEGKGIYYVAESGGQVVGQLMITHEWSDWRDADMWWVQSVYVHPDYRKGGVFKALFAHAENEARAKGVCAIRLYVHTDNQAAQGCYQRLGMSVGHYVVMEKGLSVRTGEIG